MSGALNPVLTIREQCLEALVQVYQAMTAGAPTQDPFTLTWGVVDRAKLADVTWKQQYALGVYEGHETKQVKNLLTYCRLQLVLEFRYVLQTGQDPSTELNRVLGDLQRATFLDPTLGGLAIDIQETDNEFYVDDVDQHRLAGALMLTMSYRHAYQDPRSPV